MEQQQRNNLRQNRVNIIKDLEPRDVLDHLLEDGVLTENDCELIGNGKTRKERCQILLSLLPTRGSSAYGSFLRALGDTQYSFLEDKLASLAPETTEVKIIDDVNDNVDQGVMHCSRCSDFLSLQGKSTTFSLILKKHCCLLLDNIEPRDLVDYHYQEEILSEDECERICVGTTRRDRCVTMLKMLENSTSESVLSVFQNSLKKKYLFISKTINNTIKTIPKHNGLCAKDKEDVSSEALTYFQNSESNVPSLDFKSLLTSNDNLSRDMPVVKKLESKDTANKQPTFQPSSRMMDSVLEASFTQSILPTDDWKKRLDNNQADSASLRPALSVQEHIISPLRNIDDSLQSSGSARHEYSDESNNIKAFAQNGKQSSVLSTTGTPSDACHRKEMIDNYYTGIQLEKEYDEENSQISSTVDKNILMKQKELSKNPGKEDTTAFPQQSSSSKQFENMGHHKRKRLQKRKTESLVSNESEKQIEVFQTHNGKDLLLSTPGNIKSCNTPSKKLLTAFNCLSNLINQGQYEQFELLSRNVRQRYAKNPDMMCILGYLHASRDLYKTDFDGAKHHIDDALDIVPQTSNPKYFTLELFTAKTRMYISRKKLEKLESTLDDAKMIIESDKLGCSGRAAGWLYMNDGRNKTAQIAMLNVNRPNYIDAYQKLHRIAEHSFRQALVNFQQDGGKDGPFGMGYAICRLVILLMRCGDNGLTMNILHPPDDDVKVAGGYIRQLEDSEISIPKILEVHFLLAKCDYQFRRKNFVRALEHAEAAFQLSTEIQMLEFTDHAHNRLLFLKTKSPLLVQEVDSFEEAYEILLSSDSGQGE